MGDALRSHSEGNLSLFVLKLHHDGFKEGCCQFCFIMSCVAVPLMFFFGYLCKSNSPMIELKDEMKADAGSGCYMAGLMYLVTIFVSYGIVNSKDESASAREIHIASDNNK